MMLRLMILDVQISTISHPKNAQAVDFVRRLLDEGTLGTSSKLNAEAAFSTHLRDIGRERADAWLNRHFIDLNHMFRPIGVHHND